MRAAKFSTKGLRSEVRSTDGYDYDIDFSKPIDEYIEEAEKIIDDPKEYLNDFHSFRIRSKNAISYKYYPTVLVLRLLATYLKRRYSLQTETRELVTRGVIQALSDSTEMTVLRRDISSFYEFVPTYPLRDELLFKDVLPPRARRLLEVFFEIHCATGTGLPRGLGLSAVLSEYVMQPTDQAIRLIPGVYRYHRFVDDIIVFCTQNTKAVIREIESALPHPLELNRKKGKLDDVQLEKPSGENFSKVHFDYLGYKYTIDHSHTKGKARKLVVSVSDNKIKKIQTRLIRSSNSYLKNPDFSLLYDRVRYLAGNYKFEKKRPIAATGSVMVKSGIFYNYRYCGHYQGDKRSLHAMPELKRLDWFLQNSILGTRHPTGRAVLGALSPIQLSMLRRISFAQGHLRVYHSRFGSSRVKMIKSAWKHG